MQTTETKSPSVCGAKNKVTSQALRCASKVPPPLPPRPSRYASATIPASNQPTGPIITPVRPVTAYPDVAAAMNDRIPELNFKQPIPSSGFANATEFERGGAGSIDGLISKQSSAITSTAPEGLKTMQAQAAGRTVSTISVDVLSATAVPDAKAAHFGVSIAKQSLLEAATSVLSYPTGDSVTLPTRCSSSLPSWALLDTPVRSSPSIDVTSNSVGSNSLSSSPPAAEPCRLHFNSGSKEIFSPLDKEVQTDPDDVTVSCSMQGRTVASCATSSVAIQTDIEVDCCRVSVPEERCTDEEIQTLKRTCIALTQERGKYRLFHSCCTALDSNVGLDRSS